MPNFEEVILLLNQSVTTDPLKYIILFETLSGIKRANLSFDSDSHSRIIAGTRIE